MLIRESEQRRAARQQESEGVVLCKHCGEDAKCCEGEPVEGEGVVVEIEPDEHGEIGMILYPPNKLDEWWNDACGPIKVRITRVQDGDK